MTYAARKDQAHHLIDAITPEQLNAVVLLLEVMTSPAARDLPSIPFEDEPISDRENAEAAATTGPWIPLDQAMAELNITQADLDLQRMQDEASVSS